MTLSTRLLRATAVLALLLALILGALPAQAAEKLKVVATFSILADLVKNVGGDAIELSVFVPAESDAHNFSPAPQDAAKLAEAALIFENGLGFEEWLDDLYAASGSKAARIAVTNGLEPMAPAEGHDHEDHAAEAVATAESTKEADHDHEDHDHGEADPHMWQDVQHAIHMVGQIRDALISADLANASLYQANAEAYIAALEELDAYAVTRFSSLPEARRIVFTSHDAFAYLGARYGLTVDAVLGVTTEASDPAAAEIAAIIEEIKESGVPVIFAEVAINPAVIETIAKEANVTLGPDLYSDSLSEAGGVADTYLKLFRHNVDSIVDNLSK
jgi:zinc/manganese transport system substrate-binding protein